jgi:hypothetical protein
VVSLGSDGRIRSQGSLSSALEKDAKLSADVEKEKLHITKADETVIEDEAATLQNKPAGKLIIAEEVEEGHVGWSASEYFESRLPVTCSLPILSETPVR